MAFLMLLACLGIIGTAMCYPSSNPTDLHDFMNFLPKGWTTDDLLRALSSNYSSIQQGSCTALASFGGSGGSPFDDPCFVGTKIDRMQIHVGQVVDCTNCITGIRTYYRDGTTKSHGTFGSSTRSYMANLNGADLIGVAVRSKKYIDQVTFLTVSSSGAFRVLGPYGGSKGNSGITFGEIQALFGRSKRGIDNLGFKGKLFT